MYGSFPFNETFLVFSEVTRFKPFNELIQSFEVFLRFFDLVPVIKLFSLSLMGETK
jgi:hypothetical protein